MGIKYEIVASNGSYKTKSGDEKKRWLKIGVVMETDRGLSIKLESVPVGWDGWAILSIPKEREKPKDFNDIPDDLPF